MPIYEKYQFTIITVGILFFCARVSLAQITPPNIDQLKLIQVFVGTWQHNIGKDTVDVWEVHQYENAFVTTMYLVTTGKRSFTYTENWGFSLSDGKFKGYILYPNGGYQTWIGLFTSESIFSGDIVKDFNPYSVTKKFYLKIEIQKVSMPSF